MRSTPLWFVHAHLPGMELLQKFLPGTEDFVHAREVSLGAPLPKPGLKLVHGAQGHPVDYTWFCGHCASRAPRGQAPAPHARVCAACGLGLLIETRADVAPKTRDAFVVVDAGLLVQAVSRHAEQLLGLDEGLAVNRPVAGLLVAADAETTNALSLAGAIAAAVSGDEQPAHAFVRPWNTFGVRMRASIAACGPPRAALIVLDQSQSALRAIER